jgi:uncharacterized membrane protein required for colicin V production
MALEKLNWVDFVILILLSRICYIAVRSGLLTELFKLLGIVLAVYLSMHYYVIFSDYLASRLWLKYLAGDFMNFLSFLTLALIGYLVFLGLRIVFVKFIKAESTPGLHKWGGIIVGIARGFLLASLFVFALAISGLGYVHKSVGNSYSGRYLVGVGSGVYSGMWNNIMSKFMNAEKFNQAIPKVQKALGSVKK